MELMTREEANNRILICLEYLITKYPDWRFHQILQNIGIIDIENPDKFYEESIDTLRKLMKTPIIKGEIINIINKN